MKLIKIQFLEVPLIDYVLEDKGEGGGEDVG